MEGLWGGSLPGRTLGAGGGCGFGGVFLGGSPEAALGCWGWRPFLEGGSLSPGGLAVLFGGCPCQAGALGGGPREGSPGQGQRAQPGVAALG